MIERGPRAVGGGPPLVSFFPGPPPGHLPGQFFAKDPPHHEDHGPDPLAAAPDGAQRAAVVAGHAAQRRRYHQRPHDLPAQDERHRRRHVGGQVPHLGAAGGGDQIHGQQGREGHDHKGAGARAHDAVVAAHEQADEQAHRRLIAPGAGLSRRLPAEIPLHRQEHRHQGQGHQHELLQQLLRQALGDLRADVAPRQGPGGGAEGRDRQDLPAPEELHRGGGGADTVDHLVGAGGEVDGHPGHEIRRQGDEAPAPRHAVHEAS